MNHKKGYKWFSDPNYKLKDIRDFEEKLLDSETERSSLIGNLSCSISSAIEYAWFSFRGSISRFLTKIAMSISPDGVLETVYKNPTAPEIFDLNSYAAEYIIPRLDKFIESIKNSKYPFVPLDYNNSKEWLSDLATVRKFLEDIKNVDSTMSKEEYKRAEEIFGKVFARLWD